MMKSLSILGYRCYSQFRLSELGRINLLVGTNNSGKTSILEALHLAAAEGELYPVWQAMTRRGERFADDRTEFRRSSPELEVSHLFHGHRIVLGCAFTVSAQNNGVARAVKCSIVPSESVQPAQQTFFDEEVLGVSPSALLVESPSGATAYPLTRRGGLKADTIRMGRAPSRTPSRTDEPANIQLVSTDSLGADELTSLWESIALTREEELVLDALRTLDPDIERIAVVASGRYSSGPRSRGGFLVKHRSSDQPIPIGSMGDGIWRMLVMAITIIRCQNGVLLVDEIDTGLHYTAMSDMWKLVAHAAERLNVQVFATTHSSDCVQSLASICRQDVDADSHVTIQRIERERELAVAFTEAEIVAAAERHVEVR